MFLVAVVHGSVYGLEEGAGRCRVFGLGGSDVTIALLVTPPVCLRLLEEQLLQLHIPLIHLLHHVHLLN